MTELTATEKNQIRLTACAENLAKLTEDLIIQVMRVTQVEPQTRVDITLDGRSSYIKVDGEDYINLDGNIETAEKLIGVLDRLYKGGVPQPEDDEEDDED